jgi:hypothetical protein
LCFSFSFQSFVCIKTIWIGNTHVMQMYANHHHV